jgi:lysyl-tRNA synthetase class 1
VWADLLVEEILKSRGRQGHVVNDAWSPSGYAHIGSLKGVVLHDAIARGLHDRGVPAQFLYGFDDFDPFDGAPPYLDRERFAPFLGVPLVSVPSPEPGAASFGEFFSRRFIEVYERVGCRPQPYSGSELYRSGRMNEAIRRVLDRAEEVLEIDREISGSQRAMRHPLQVLCEQCGKIATTLVTGWDGREVAYECLPDKVSWAVGCGHRSRRSPFDGGAKLIYRVEWAAKWWVLGVTVEGAGKDHFTRGGSHDTASAVVERIFGYPPPFPIPYEFLLIGGARMAGSAGRGVMAHEFLQMFRPALIRFLLVRLHYREQKNFDPGGDTIPRLYDEYDRAARAFDGEVDDAELARTFWYARLDGERTDVARPRFAKVASLVQIPGVDLPAVVAAEKGAPLTPEDLAELAQRTADARRWLERYAPEAYRFEVQRALPPAAAALSVPQQEFLARLAEAVQGEPLWQGDVLHGRIHELKNTLGLSPQEAFSAIYLAFLGKPSGPQAGWLLAALDRSFVLQRLREAAGTRAVS